MIENLSQPKTTLVEAEFNGNIKSSLLNKELGFPRLIKNVDNSTQLTEWLKQNQKQYEATLSKEGGMLCRGFNIDTVEKFKDVAEVFPNELLEYKLRSSPRYSITDNVYVSTTYPEDQSIHMHSENSYSPESPSRIIFCCIIPADVQGETPIADNRQVLKNIRPDIVEKFRKHGVLYKRNLTGFIGMSWEEVFQTSNRKEAEKMCRENNMDFQWLGDDHLQVSWKKSAIWEHPVSGESVWFNHAMFFNKYSTNEDLLEFLSSDDELPNNTYYGDGSEITKEEIENIREAYRKATVIFPWEKGDVLFLDNMLISHGRNPYQGERKIVVSMS
jgi:hypothetical protein